MLSYYNKAHIMTKFAKIKPLIPYTNGCILTVKVHNFINIPARVTSFVVVYYSVCSFQPNCLISDIYNQS